MRGSTQRTRRAARGLALILFAVGVAPLAASAAAKPDPADPSLIAYLPLDDGADPATDVSGNGHAGDLQPGGNEPVYQPNAAPVPGNPSSLHFDGSGQQVVIPDAPDLDFDGTRPFSLAFWVNADPYDPDGLPFNILGKREPGCGQINYQFAQDTGPMGLHFNGGSGAVPTGVNLPVGQWLHIAATYNGGGHLRLFVNGNPVAERFGYGPGPTNDGDLQLGVAGDCSHFRGLIDEFSLFDRELPQEEVCTLGCGALPPPPPPTDWVTNPANGHRYRLSEPAPWQIAADEAGSFGGYLTTINDPGEEAWIQGTFGNAESFWIGLNDIEVEGEFVWMNGEPVTYTHWCEFEPNDLLGIEDAVSMNARLPDPDSEPCWNDVPIDGMIRGVVEALPEGPGRPGPQYTDPQAFANAIAGLGEPTLVDFDDIDAMPGNGLEGREPFDGSHYADRGVTFANANDVALYVAPGGLTTCMAGDVPDEGDCPVWNESNSLSVGEFPFPEEVVDDNDDDLVIRLDPPASAVGFTLVDNAGNAPDEYIEFRDGEGVVANVGLPGEFRPFRSFAGIVSRGRPITEIVIVERADDGDDVNYDDIIVVPPPAPDFAPSLMVRNKPIVADYGTTPALTGWARAIDVDVANVGSLTGVGGLDVWVRSVTDGKEIFIGSTTLQVRAGQTKRVSFDWNGLGMVGDVVVYARTCVGDDRNPWNDTASASHYVLAGGTAFGVTGPLTFGGGASACGAPE